jgi:hypothetical protein
MVDSVGGINSTNSAGTDGNSASRNEATTQDLSSNNTGSVEQSMTTADRLMSSPTTVEKLSGIYNNYVDPVVDYLAGRDVAEIPPVPDYLDHGIAIGGHVVVGEGVSGKFGGSVEIGNGQLFKMSTHRKFGVGQVFGNGITFGVK